MCWFFALTSIVLTCKAGSLSSAKQTAVGWSKRSTDGNRRFSKHHCYAYIVHFLGTLAAAHCAAAVAKFPFCEKQSRVRFVHGLCIVDTPWTWIWAGSENPCLEAACRTQYWGKIKPFFSVACIFSQEAAGEWDNEMPCRWWYIKLNFWSLHIYYIPISSVPSALTFFCLRLKFMQNILRKFTGSGSGIVIPLRASSHFFLPFIQRGSAI